MKGKKVFIADILNHTGLLRLIARRTKPYLIVYNYHRIRPDKIGEASNFDEDVFGPTVTTFRTQVKWLKSNTRIISEIELLEFVETMNFPKEICSMITFDDGYIDNYTLAYPILKSENVPAIYFIPSKSIMSRQLGWWDIVSYILKNSRKEAIIFNGDKIRMKGRYSQVKNYFLNKFKLEPNKKTKRLIDDLSNSCEVPLPDTELQGLELMSWEQIREVAQNNIAIGSHTHNHYALATLKAENQFAESKISKDTIEQKIKRVVNTISYPVGGYYHFTSKTQEVVKQCGYRLAFSFNTGTNDWRRINNYDIKRIAPPESNNLFAATAVLPNVFAWCDKAKK